LFFYEFRSNIDQQNLRSQHVRKAEVTSLGRCARARPAAPPPPLTAPRPPCPRRTRSMMMIGGLAVCSGLQVGMTAPRVQSRSSVSNVVMAADIIATVAALEGPVVYWGADGPAVGKEESDIKGYDNFGSFIAAVQKAGLTSALQGPGPLTVLVPTDAAFAQFKGELTADILKYHVIPGKVTIGSIGGNQPTLQGNELTYRRYVRKTFLDDAMMGISSAGASKGQQYPCDVECSNGLVHAIDCVLTPGYVMPINA